MNKVCFVTKNKDTYFIKKAFSLLEKNCCVFFNPWEDQHFPVAQHYLIRTSGVYGNDHDLEILDQHLDKKLINPPSALRLCRGKDTQYARWPDIVPHWIDLRGTSFEKALEFQHQHNKVVVKPVRGQGGWGVECFRDQEDLEKWWSKQTKVQDFDYLLQPFLEGKEVRVFFIQDQYLGLKRWSPGGVANFAQGGEAVVWEVTPEVRAIVDRVRTDSGAFYGACDFILADRPYLLELNLVPGIEQLESVSNLEVATLLFQALGIAK